MTTLDKIKAEIQKVLDVEGDSENAKAQALALFWVLELIDKYAEQEPKATTTSTDEPMVIKYPQVDGITPTVVKAEQEPCDDAVSRQAVLKQLKSCLTGGETEYQYVKLHIDSLPSVRPQEPKTGHWIILDDCEQFIAKCSKCGRIEDSRMISKYTYCHCGAKMVEPQESEGTNEEM